MRFPYRRVLFLFHPKTQAISFCTKNVTHVGFSLLAEFALSARPKDSQGNSLATVLTTAIFTIFTASTKVAAFGRATSFVVFLRCGCEYSNIVALKTVAREFPWASLRRADSKFSQKTEAPPMATRAKNYYLDIKLLV